jgi:hypothetical protein
VTRYCPNCDGELREHGETLSCDRCDQHYVGRGTWHYTPPHPVGEAARTASFDRAFARLREAHGW